MYVGETIVRRHGARWLVRDPLWESQVELQSSAGVAALAPFQWLLKSLADAEVDRTPLADRYRTLVENPRLDVSSLPIIAARDGSLVRLARPRYHNFFQYLKAHVPEIRDLGPDFPAPERFEELGLRWLDFAWLGGGRAILAHGPGASGVHMFWLTADGFFKAALLPADAAPEHRLEIDGDLLRLTLSYEGAMQTQEMLWWGP